MANRTANYTAFYVKEPFNESNLGANATPDFLYYNQLRAWKAADSSFPFVDAHAKTYNVRDDSDWETLKARLHERLDASKNIILFLSGNTKNSLALREEIDYGINTKGLPVIVIYPDFKEKSDIWCSTGMRKQIKDLKDPHVQIKENDRVFFFDRGRYQLILNLSKKDYELNETVVFGCNEDENYLKTKEAVLVERRERK